MSKRSWAAKAADLERRFRDDLARRRLDRTNPPIMREGLGPQFSSNQDSGKAGGGAISYPLRSHPFTTLGHPLCRYRPNSGERR